MIENYEIASMRQDGLITNKAGDILGLFVKETSELHINGVVDVIFPVLDEQMAFDILDAKKILSV